MIISCHGMHHNLLSNQVLKSEVRIHPGGQRLPTQDRFFKKILTMHLRVFISQPLIKAVEISSLKKNFEQVDFFFLTYCGLGLSQLFDVLNITWCPVL